MAYRIIATGTIESGAALAHLRFAEVALSYLKAARSMNVGVVVWNNDSEISEEDLKRRAEMERRKHSD